MSADLDEQTGQTPFFILRWQVGQVHVGHDSRQNGVSGWKAMNEEWQDGQ